MTRLTRAVLPAALLLALAAAPASAHEGNPDYRSEVRQIVPQTAGLTAQVLDHDDALLLVNHSDRDVVVLAPGGVPYARLLADGTVQVNERAPAVDAEEAAEEHEHEDDRADRGARLSASLDGRFLAHGDEQHESSGQGSGHEDEDEVKDAREGPQWRTLDRTGRLQWHDGRIKYRASAVAPQVTDTSRETKVKDWRVPLRVAGQPGAILGTLTWVGEPGAGSSFPTGAVVSLVIVALLAVAVLVLVRRRPKPDAAAGGQER
jgi:hypothetical protein